MRWLVQILRAQEYSGSMTAGSAVLTSATAGFTATDVGRRVIVAGAADTSENLETQIIAYTSATQVTLLDACVLSVSAVPLFVWRPMDLTGITLSAQGKVTVDDVDPAITFTCTVTDAADGRMYLILPKEESVLVTAPLLWDLQTVDTADNNWTETVMRGKVKLGSGKQVTV